MDISRQGSDVRIGSRNVHARWCLPVLAVVTGALLAGCASGSAADDEVRSGSESSYAYFDDADDMVQAAELVADASGPAIRTERTVSFPSHRVSVESGGSSVAEPSEVAVYAMTVSDVRKGDAVRPGETILVAPAVDQDAVPSASQEAILEGSGDLTLYLLPVNGEHDVWTTLSPYQGIEQR